MLCPCVWPLEQSGSLSGVGDAWVLLCPSRNFQSALGAVQVWAAGPDWGDPSKVWGRWAPHCQLAELPLLSTKSASVNSNVPCFPSLFFTCHFLVAALPHTPSFSTLAVHWRIRFAFLPVCCTPENAHFLCLSALTPSSSLLMIQVTSCLIPLPGALPSKWV